MSAHAPYCLTIAGFDPSGVPAFLPTLKRLSNAVFMDWLLAQPSRFKRKMNSKVLPGFRLIWWSAKRKFC